MALARREGEHHHLSGHGLAGWKHFNAEQREHGKPQIGYVAFLHSSEFGETVFENWESEFLQAGPRPQFRNRERLNRPGPMSLPDSTGLMG